eukprot:COSAG02_NODE_38550_length_427_cov_10.338415_1_plen_80_part_00
MISKSWNFEVFRKIPDLVEVSADSDCLRPGGVCIGETGGDSTGNLRSGEPTEAGPTALTTRAQESCSGSLLTRPVGFRS